MLAPRLRRLGGLLTAQLVLFLLKHIREGLNAHEKPLFLFLEKLLAEDLECFKRGIRLPSNRVFVLRWLASHHTDILSRLLLLSISAFEVERFWVVARREGELALGLAIDYALPVFYDNLVGREPVSLHKVILVLVFKHLQLLERLFIDELCECRLLHHLQRG